MLQAYIKKYDDVMICFFNAGGTIDEYMKAYLNRNDDEQIGKLMSDAVLKRVCILKFSISYSVSWSTNYLCIYSNHVRFYR